MIAGRVLGRVSRTSLIILKGVRAGFLYLCDDNPEGRRGGGYGICLITIPQQI